MWLLRMSLLIFLLHEDVRSGRVRSFNRTLMRARGSAMGAEFRGKGTTPHALRPSQYLTSQSFIRHSCPAWSHDVSV